MFCTLAAIYAQANLILVFRRSLRIEDLQEDGVVRPEDNYTHDVLEEDFWDADRLIAESESSVNTKSLDVVWNQTWYFTVLRLDEQTEETPEAGSVNLNEMDALPQQSEMKEEKMRGESEL